MGTTRQALIYLATIVVVGIGTIGVLRLGASLPVPAQVAATIVDSPASQPPLVSGNPFQAVRANLSHPLSQLFIQLLVVIVAARVTGHVFTLLGIPAVVGEMTVGILLGPSVFGWLTPAAFAFVFPADSLGVLKLLSQLGICLFMFAVGMDINMKHMRGNARCAVAVSHTSIVVPFLLGVMLAYPLFGELAGSRATFTSFALFMGISMSITAFPVLARILRERGMTHTPLGSIALTCAAVEDVTAWSIMAFVVAAARSSSGSEALLAVLLVVLFVAVMGLGVRRVLPHWLGHRRLTQEEPSNGTLTIVVCVVFGAAFVTEVIGVHALFGAFLAGAIMPDVEGFRARVGARIERFSSTVLVPLFFAFTGLRTEVSLLGDAQGWLLCLLIIAVATVGKLGAGAAAARISGMGWRDSLLLGALINTRGLMELIALNIAYDLGILSPRIFTMLVIMALATTFMTGPLLTLFGSRRSGVGARSQPSELPQS